MADSQIDPSFGDSVNSSEPIKNQVTADDVAAAAVAQSIGDIPNDRSPSPDTTPAATAVKSKANRPLSQSKRAIQNRVAQRKFRQKKEKTYKELEEKAARLDELERYVLELRKENSEFRDYILALQSKMLQKEGKDSAAPPPPQSFVQSLLKPAGVESTTSSLINSVLGNSENNAFSEEKK